MKYHNLPSVTKLEKNYVAEAINSNWLSINGKNKKFLKKIFKTDRKKKLISCSSGTAALHVALKALGVDQNDNVIVPDYTCVSNLSAVSQCKAKAIMVDLEKDTLGLDFNKTALAIKKYKPKVLGQFMFMDFLRGIL